MDFYTPNFILRFARSPTMTDHPPKITFAEIRASGVRDVLIYCRDHHCSHHIRISADLWPDHLRLSDIEERFVCQVCGKRGAESLTDHSP